MGIFSQLGVIPLINAAGTLTRLSGSLMLPEVSDAMAEASRSFVDMEELHLAAGQRIADLLGVEAAHVCNGAAAGITLMAAACIAGAEPARIAQLPDVTGLKHRFVVQQAHRNPFDQALRLAGGKFVEVDAEASALSGALNEQVVGVYYTHAWFCTGAALPLPQVVEIAHSAGVSVIVDAAAEIPPPQNLTRFVEEGADLVAFSGGKILRGPQASGFVLGRRDLIEACRANDCPNMAVGRPMKVGKEEIAGLVRALELYLVHDHAVDLMIWERRVAYVLQALSELDHVRAWRQLPFGLGQQIPHVALTWNEERLGIGHKQVVKALRDGQPRIAVQLVSPDIYDFSDYAAPEVRIHPHTLREGEEVIVARRVMEVLRSRC